MGMRRDGSEEDIARVMRRVRRIYWAHLLSRAPAGSLLLVSGSVVWLGRAVSWRDVWHNLPPFSHLGEVALFSVAAVTHTEWEVLLALGSLFVGGALLVRWTAAQLRPLFLLRRFSRA